MTLENYLIVLIKRWKLVVNCFVVVGVGAFIVSRLITPIYQSTALVQIALRSNNNQADINSLLASDQLVQTEVKLAASDPVLYEVASHYPGLTVQELSQEVTTTPVAGTQIFEIDVQDPSPARAAEIANDIAATLIKQQAQFDHQVSNQTRQEMQNDLKQTQQQIVPLTSQINALQLQKASGNSAQIAELQVQLVSLQQHYSQVQGSMVQLEETDVQNGDFLRVFQPARPSFKPVIPNTRLTVAAGLVAGLLLGMSLALLFERLDTHVRTPEALTQLLGWPILATILQAKPKENVINPTGKNANVEPYRILRTNIGYSAIEKPLRTLLVTSAAPRDGKSAVAANLAIFMARAGKSTLLIDADLRHPALHEMFGLPALTMGFSNAMLAFSMPSAPSPLPSSTPAATRTPSLDPFVHEVDDIPNLCIMPSGPLPPNPPELLDSKAMQHLLTALGSCGAEVVIFDTPPLLGLSDASILASKVDGTLVVVDITCAKQGDLKQLKAILEQTEADILGCVVNKQSHSRDHAIYSYQATAHKQNGRSSHSRKNEHIAPVTLDIMKEPKTQLQQDLSDITVKLVPVHPKEIDTQSQPDLSDRDKVNLTPVYPVQPETQSRPDLLEGRESG